MIVAIGCSHPHTSDYFSLPTCFDLSEIDDLSPFLVLVLGVGFWEDLLRKGHAILFYKNKLGLGEEWDSGTLQYLKKYVILGHTPIQSS